MNSETVDKWRENKVINTTEKGLLSRNALPARRKSAQVRNHGGPQQRVPSPSGKSSGVWEPKGN